ncbi:putative homoserine kinase type II (protein kinase fold) [Xenococcus sp. PCC 7305]|uniref:phosphotransferase enzyme family protein n=1 Tax=Xenococcus sp. PCC 7305 TaxID=102125 RepID=UPI0002ACF810|nr:aminoglycoside phosphotransferase family protein [Xenococcus sp. PCC 7305]ELS00389.1 putative homoserine kinase type II (protein kinase fold) [Xenococcus sp. PCC 7305]
MINTLDNTLVAIAENFQFPGQVAKIREYGQGNINHTYLVNLNDDQAFILQRINTKVFRQPALVMANMGILGEHIEQKLQGQAFEQALNNHRRWEFPKILRSQAGADHYICEAGNFWRVISFIGNSQCFDVITNSEQAQEVGYGLGKFHALVSDLPVTKLADTLEGFHITPNYLQNYEQVLSQTIMPSSSESDYCRKFIHDRADWANVLENAKAEGILQLRTIHGDPKVNNIMFDRERGKAIAMIDLDTVKPGLVHYDIGDCLRSGCNLLGEETSQWQKVTFDLELAEAILEGYFKIAQEFLTPQDYAYIYDAIALITFELGLRFFTDYLAGNIYFKVNYPEHNLMRALVQFQLTTSIESQEKLLRQIIARY